MSRAPRRHGERARYIAGCRCDPCVKANAKYCKQYRWRSRGSRLSIDPTEVRAHVESLTMSLTALAAVSGVPRATISSIVNGKVKATSPATAAALLAVAPDAPIGHHYIDGIGARRRLQALAAIGWSGDVLAARLRYARRSVFDVRSGAQGVLTGDFDQAIRALYEELQDTPPVPTCRTDRSAVTRTVNEARKRGYLPPAAWDDPDRDPEPGEDDDFVDEIKVERVVAGEKLPCSKAVLVAVFDAWLKTDRPLNELFRVTGWNITRLQERHRVREAELAA